MREPHLYPALSLRGLLLLPVAMLPSLIASVVGGMLTAPSLSSWYPTLQKPFFTPPNILFPLVWTFLYALMAVAFWRILRTKPEIEGRRRAVLVFLGQMVLNVMWSFAFFAKQSPIQGLLVIGLLILAIVMTIRSFMVVDRPAGLALLPYLAWVAFASILNGAIVILNR